MRNLIKDWQQSLEYILSKPKIGSHTNLHVFQSISQAYRFLGLKNETKTKDLPLIEPPIGTNRVMFISEDIWLNIYMLYGEQ